MDKVLNALIGQQVTILLGKTHTRVTVELEGGGIVQLRMADGTRLTLAVSAVVLVGPPFG